MALILFEHYCSGPIFWDHYTWTLVSSQVVSWDWHNQGVRSFNLDKPGEKWQYFRFEVSEQERTSIYCDRIAIREILFH